MKSAAQKCIHLLLWATNSCGQLNPLAPDTRKDVIAAWSSQVPVARAALQVEVAAAGQQMTSLDACPGSMSDTTQATAAAVGCAIVFEVLGSICGLLPPNGWLRAKEMFSKLMVCNKQSVCSDNCIDIIDVHMPWAETRVHVMARVPNSTWHTPGTHSDTTV